MPKSKSKPTLKTKPKAKPAEIAQVPPSFQSIHALHFAELGAIWDNDKRIPSAVSRRAWALARNLNPNNVNKWWYRQRAFVRKSRVRMLRDTYELPVGTPPVIEVKCEETTVDICVSGDGSEAGKSPRSDALGADNLGSDDTLVEAITSIPKMERRKCAHTRAYTRIFSSAAPISRSSSRSSDSRQTSLSPSLTPARSPSPLLCYPLFLPSSDADLDTACGTGETMSLENADDELWCGAHTCFLDGFVEALDEKQFEEATSLTSSACSDISVLNLPSEEVFDPTTELFDSIAVKGPDIAPTDAPWCLAGSRFACDGSFLGFCSRCYRIPCLP